MADHIAGNAARGSIRDRPAGGRCFRFESDHGGGADLGDCGNALDPEDGRENSDGIRVDRERSLDGVE